MATLVTIKQRIQQLDAGSFQILCDAYLSKIGYPNIVSLGTKAGTQKTTLGTPDTYFTNSNGKYVFAEYTTQQESLYSKIKKDIEKCLDPSSTHIPYNQISEIVYCHTSSNLAPSHDSDLKKCCEDVGIKLTLIGIDQLAEDINSNYHGLARDYLALSIDTEQIQPKDEFIKQHDANSLAAPIDTPFLFREKELSDIDKAFQNVNVVIIVGAAGTGKTRLALEYAQTHALKHKERLYCIHDRALPLYEDLKSFIDRPGQYFILVDDANQLSALKHVVEYTNKQIDGYDVKLLITVRNYAIQKVRDDICDIVHYELLFIKAFSDDEIKSMLEKSLGILNEDYLNRIARISEGNARIAMLAGKIACTTDRLSSIDDVSQLYDEYYGGALRETSLESNIEFLISAGIIAFLAVVRLDQLDLLALVLESNNISEQNFTKSVYKLYEFEIVDVSHDKIVRFSEQCFANFILKYVFYDKKLLRIADMVELFFSSNRERVLFSINTLLEVFQNPSLHQYVKDELRALWRKLAEEKSPIFFDFVKMSFKLNPTETLLILKEKIESEPNICISADEIDTEKGKNYSNINDDILAILGGFASSADLDAALDLYFLYYLKRPDMFMQFYHAAIVYYCIQSDSDEYEYYTQIKFIKKLYEKSDGGKNDFIAILFLEVAEEFLKLRFSPFESGRNNKTITIHNIPLKSNQGVTEYRSFIWTFLLEISQNSKYINKIKKILSGYGKSLEDCSTEVVKNDSPYIIKLLTSAFPPLDLSNCILASHIKEIMDISKIDTNVLDNYMESEKFKLYHVLQEPKWDDELSFEERPLERERNIQKYLCAASSPIEGFKRILDICNEVNYTDPDHQYFIGDGLRDAFQCLRSNKDDYVTAVKCYIELDTPLCLALNPISIVNLLFSMIPVDEVLTIIVSKEYSQKNTWLYAYYHELPQQYIAKNPKILDELYAFLEDKSDCEIKSSPLRDIDFLEKYNVLDQNAFVNSCRILLSKISYSPFIVDIYFDLMFNKNHNAPHSVVERFSNDFNLLEEIYMKTTLNDNHNDYDGNFLREIYLVRPSIAVRYTKEMLTMCINFHNDNSERNRTFFSLKNFIEIYDDIIDELIKSSSYTEERISCYIKSLIIARQKDDALLYSQDKWIRHYICTFSNDVLRIRLLFAAVSELTSERRLEYMKLFLAYNQRFDIFKEIPLFPETYSWSDSAVPLLSSWIDSLQNLLPTLTGLQFIEHKKRVESEIEDLRRYIEDEEIRNILRG